MSRFIGNLVITPVAKKFDGILSGTRTQWRLVEDFGFESDHYGTIIAPAGFTHNLASGLRITKPVVDDDDWDILRAAAIHDFLYYWRGEPPTTMRVFSRKDADNILAEGMRCVGAKAWRVAVVYRAVRMFGGLNW